MRGYFQMEIYIDGKYYDKADAKVSVFDHGLLYGDGVFEGIRIYNGKVFRIKEHIERLYESAKAIILEIPMTKEEMKTDDPYGLRKMSLEDLCNWIGDHNDTTSGGKAMNFLGQFELKRRMENPNRIRSTIAIIIATLALLASAIDLGLKISKF